jgi:hypothetical protein
MLWGERLLGRLRGGVRWRILLSSMEDGLMIGVCDGGCRLWIEVVFGWRFRMVLISLGEVL